MKLVASMFSKLHGQLGNKWSSNLLPISEKEFGEVVKSEFQEITSKSAA